MNKHRRGGACSIFWIAWVAVALACNYPGYLGGPAGLSVEALRQTMAAPAQTAGPPATQPAAPSSSGLSTATPAGLPAVTPGGVVEDPTRIRYVSQPGDTASCARRKVRCYTRADHLLPTAACGCV